MRQDGEAVIGSTYRGCRLPLNYITGAEMIALWRHNMSASLWAIGYLAYLRAHGIDENKSYEVRNAVVVDWILDQSHEFDGDHLDGQIFSAWLEAKYPIAEAVEA